jgi:hypothetical protein
MFYLDDIGNFDGCEVSMEIADVLGHTENKQDTRKHSGNSEASNLNLLTNMI